MMSDEENIKEAIKKLLDPFGTFVQDQISAVKSEAQKAVTDSDTALEIGATLEKRLAEIDLRLTRTQALTAIAFVSYGYYIAAIALTFAHPNDRQAQLDLSKGAISLSSTTVDYIGRVVTAQTTEEVSSLPDEFIAQLSDIKNLIRKYAT